jgi:L-2-hydroxyglutarate oxidase
MLNGTTYDIVVVGGGIVGMATAMALTSHYQLSLIVLEAEDRLAAHQTGNNSGVIHSGLYYKPGSAKAKNCTEGREALYQFCQEHGVAHERCGKIVVATRPDELPALERLAERGQANGLEGLRKLTPAEIKEFEPHAAGLAGLHVPITGIVDYRQVTEAYANLVRSADGTIQTGARVLRCQIGQGEMVLETTRGEVHCRHLIGCAGLYADRFARMCGVDPKVQIVPFRGEYYELVPPRWGLVRNLIYPVPDPRFPFLGVHFTRMIHGGVEAGPNAVLALKREGYRRTSLSPRDALQMATYPGVWRMARRYWRTGMGELFRSFSKRAFVKALQRLLPDLKADDLQRAGAGVRAQALDSTGQLVDDFHIVEAERMIHVLNAPSPAATASISIGRTIMKIAATNFQLRARSNQPDDLHATLASPP